MVYGQEPPSDQELKVSFTGEGVLAGYAPGVFEPGWLRITAQEPMTATQEATFAIAINPGNRPGTYSTNLRFVTGKADGSSLAYKDLPISFTVTGPAAIQPRRIYASRNGVALVSLPDTSKITSTVTIYDTSGTVQGLSASSDQPWLQTSISSNKVILQAAPDGLPQGMNFATVTVQSTVINEAAETIRVGLYISETASKTGDLANASGMNAIAVSPTHPWFFVADMLQIRAYNIYSGEVEKTFANTPGNSIESLAPSSDGRQLFAHAAGGHKQIYCLDIEKNEWTTINYKTYRHEHGGFDPYPTEMLYIRPSGHPILLLSSRVALDAATGALINENVWPAIYYKEAFAVSADQRNVATIAKGLSGILHLNYYELEYYPNGNVYMQKKSWGANAETMAYVDDIAMSAEGDHVYIAARAPYTLMTYQRQPNSKLSYLGEDHIIDPDVWGPAYSVEVAENGLIYAARNGISVYRPDGHKVASYQAYPSHGNQGMKISGDEKRLLIFGGAISGKIPIKGFATQP